MAADIYTVLSLLCVALGTLDTALEDWGRGPPIWGPHPHNQNSHLGTLIFFGVFKARIKFGS